MRPPKRTAVRIRPKTGPSSRRDSSSHRLAVFTAVDGTLLDARTFEPGASRQAVYRLHASGVPVVPVSVMTLDEILPLASELRLQHPMIIEAGGAIARPNDGAWEIEPCGPPADTLLDVVREIEERSGADLLVYSALSESEAARLSGRSGELLEASTRRRFSEPFLIERGDLDEVSKAAAELGFSIRRGRRFLHLCRQCDEGEAFARVRDEIGCETAVALGGSAVDLEFLSRSEVPILVPGPDGEVDPGLIGRIPHARIAPAPGPEGWAAAVESALQAVSPTKRRVRAAAR